MLLYKLLKHNVQTYFSKELFKHTFQTNYPLQNSDQAHSSTIQLHNSNTT